MLKILSLCLFLFSSLISQAQEVQEVYHALERDFASNIYFTEEGINIHRDGEMSPYVNELSPDYLYNNGKALSESQIMRIPKFKFLSFEVFEKAYTGYKKIKAQDLLKKEILVVVDYSLPDTERRLFVFDLRKNNVLYNTWTHHGIGSDQDRDGIADFFSNVPKSDQSSLGFMLTGMPYVGQWGYSMRLIGIDPELNSKVLSRAVVMHGMGNLSADAISYSSSAGWSQGCITLPIFESGKFYGLADRPLNELIIKKIKNGALIFSYSDILDAQNNPEIDKSKWLK